jgi:mono/diheme cytochrome c family protein
MNCDDGVWSILRVVILLGLILAPVLMGCDLVAIDRDPWRDSDQAYESNGEQIYFTATSQRGTAITSDMQHGMMRGAVACVDCHGSEGRGGRVRVMMRVVTVPDIRYETLTQEMGHKEDDDGHPPYTDETIRRAITQGIDPAGNPLEWPMPAWNMAEDDLDDLLAFLRIL